MKDLRVEGGGRCWAEK